VTTFNILSSALMPAVQRGLLWQPNRPPRCAPASHWPVLQTALRFGVFNAFLGFQFFRLEICCF